MYTLCTLYIVYNICNAFRMYHSLQYSIQRIFIGLIRIERGMKYVINLSFTWFTDILKLIFYTFVVMFPSSINTVRMWGILKIKIKNFPGRVTFIRNGASITLLQRMLVNINGIQIIIQYNGGDACSIL